MKALNPRTVYLCCTISPSQSQQLLPFLSLFSHFSTSSSSPSSSSSSPSLWRHRDDESREVKISVWWDIENCNVPCGVNVFRVAHRITSAVRSNNIKGPISITAFGDVMQISRSTQEALSSTGICLNHIPNGGKNSADRSLLLDLVYWVSQNPPPAHLFLISGDRDFANILHRLRMSNYNILLASIESAPAVLCSAASIMWQWNSLVRGDNLNGKHFNQPPDGPYGSWYGHYKGPLDDPFSDMEQPATPKAENCADPSIDSKPRPIPRSLVNKIRHIMNSYPEGVNISELRNQLGKTNMHIDKDFYGHKKFSRLILSLPTYLKIQPTSDGQILVHAVHSKAANSVDNNFKIPTPLETRKDENDQNVGSEIRGEGALVKDVIDRSSSLTVAPQNAEGSPTATKGIDTQSTLSGSSHVKDNGSILEEAPEKVEGSPPDTKEIDTQSTLGRSSPVKENGSISEETPEKLEGSLPDTKQIDTQSTLSRSSPVKEHESISEVGRFRKIWSWFGHKLSRSDTNNTEHHVKSSTTVDAPQNKKSLEQSAEPMNRRPDPLASSCSLDVNKSVREEKTASGSGENDGKSNFSSFKQIMNWCRSVLSGTDTTHESGNCSKEVNPINNESENTKLFSEASFWEEMESFICSTKGATLISQSKSRLEMVHELQNKGPSVVNTLNTSDLLSFIELLISEKKWVQECSSTTPFKIIHPARCSTSNGRSSNGLSSMFSDTSSQSKSTVIGKDQNGCKSGAGSTKTNKKSPGKSKSEILTDCQKLVAEILKEHPEGYNICGFKKLFLERYGYSLSYQMLGYPKLASLLLSMPGLKMESTFILPSATLEPDSFIDNVRPSTSASELSDSAGKDDDHESAWDELGPIETCTSVSKKSIHKTKARVGYDGPLLDEEISDSDGEEKSKRIGEESSLLHILDSWYIDKDREACMSSGIYSADAVVDSSADEGANSNADELVNSYGRNHLKTTGSSGSDSLSPIASCGRKTVPRKNYSFVSDTGNDDKEKLIDSILGTLQKADSRVQH